MLQLGFDLPALNPATGEPVAWSSFSRALVRKIREAPWKVVDLETTGLTPFSAELSLSRTEAERGAWAKLRVRVKSVLIPTSSGGFQTYAFDADKLSAPQQAELAEALLTGVLFGWNVGFDLFWLRQLSDTQPALVLDGMLLARALRPELPVLLARACDGEEVDFELQDWARQMFLQERSGWALADVSAALLGKLVDKGRQGPRNWTAPVLDQKAFDYAIGDVVTTYEVLKALFDSHESEDLLQGYLRTKAAKPVLSLIEPQVTDIVALRENGMPFSQEAAQEYARAKYAEIAKLAAQMVELEPALAPYQAALASPLEGVGAKMKEAIGNAFVRRGLAISYTEKSGQPQIGEKDLRKVRAAGEAETKVLYDVWVGICKAKKVAQMALENAGFAARTKDSRIRSLLGHGPVTGRLSASEPNVQQYPRDPAFRALVRAAFGWMICSCDFSALDMRVGEALAIRAQRQIRQAFLTRKGVSADVLEVITYVLRATTPAAIETALAQTKVRAAESRKELQELNAREQGRRDRTFWTKWREVSRRYELRHFAEVLAEVRKQAIARGEEEWGSLRDAFSIPGMDIHTWTALSMAGDNPQQLFGSLSNEDVAAELKAQKKKLGGARQKGKVGNLSLLYAMKAAGLRETAAKNYDVHWTLEESQAVVDAWLASYPEIELWHIWTKFHEIERVKIPAREYGGELRSQSIFASKTLGGRTIYAFGLNAALSYEDQSTGADILAVAMQTLRTQYPEIFSCLVNQIHDEILAEFPADKANEYGDTLARVMVESADKFLGEYGVRVEVAPEIAPFWPKE